MSKEGCRMAKLSGDVGVLIACMLSTGRAANMTELANGPIIYMKRYLYTQESERERCDETTTQTTQKSFFGQPSDLIHCRNRHGTSRLQPDAHATTDDNGYSSVRMLTLVGSPVASAVACSGFVHSAGLRLLTGTWRNCCATILHNIRPQPCTLFHSNGTLVAIYVMRMLRLVIHTIYINYEKRST